MVRTVLHQQLRGITWPAGWLRGALLGALLAFALAGSSVSAQLDSFTVNLASLSSDGDSSVRAVVTVLDRQSRPVVELVAADFAVQLNGELAPISGLERGVDGSLPISVLLALDVSGSMEGGALGEAKAAAMNFLNSREPQARVGGVTLGGRGSRVVSQNDYAPCVNVACR